MKIAYSNLACPEWSIEEVIERAVEYGYQGIELRLFNGDIIPANLPQDARKKIVQLAGQAGIDVIGIGASTRFAMGNQEERKKQQEELLAYLELASDLNAPIVRTFGGQPDADDPQEGVDYLAESLNIVAARAEQLGIEVLLETHDYFSSSYQVQRVLNQVNSKNVGALWDIHHPYRMGETVEETFENLENRLKHIHLKDAKRKGDSDDWELVLFGQGEVPVQQVLAKLKEIGYNRYVTVEWERKWHPEIEAASIALPQHMEVLRNMLQ